MNEEHAIKLELGVRPVDTRLCIDGVDLSSRLCRITLDAAARDVPTLRITLDGYALDSPPIVIEGVLTVADPPTLQRLIALQAEVLSRDLALTARLQGGST